MTDGLSVRIERVIDAPPHVVFALYTDPARLALWQPGLRGVLEQTGPLDVPVSTYALINQVPG